MFAVGVMYRSSTNKYMKWTRARVKPPPNASKQNPTTEATESTELPLHPSLVPEVMTSGESEERTSPRKRGRPEEPPAGSSSSQHPPNPLPEIEPSHPQTGLPPLISTTPDLSSGAKTPFFFHPRHQFGI